MLWAEKYHTITDENSKLILKKIKKDKYAFIKEAMNSLK
jgi:hypothetical protein